MKFNIIGAGRLGKNLARALVYENHHHLLAICNSTRDSAQKARDEIGHGTVVGALSELPSADITFITTPDHMVPSVAAELAQQQILAPASAVVHCSGVLEVDVLHPLQQLGCFAASLHPLKAFPHSSEGHGFTDCVCTLEGDAQAIDLLKRMLTPLNANVLPVFSLNKGLYHAAAVMASNYVITLAESAITLFQQSGFTRKEARQMALQLLENGVKNLQSAETPAHALTGPLVRGDLKTIQKHLTAIQEPELLAFYKAGAKATLSMTRLDLEVLEELNAQLCE